MLDTIYFGNTLARWLIAAGIVLSISVLLKIVLRFVVRRLTRFAQKTATTVDDLVVDVLRATRWYFLLSVSVDAAAHTLHLPALAVRVLDNATLALALLQAGLWLSELLRYMLERSAATRESDASAGAYSILGVIGRVVLWAVVLLLVLDNFGVNITALVAGLGIGGIAIALAVQNVLGDLFASLSIVLDKPFVVGDAIAVDTFSGTVEKIGLKTTRIRAATGEQLIFSNTDLLKSRIRNFKRMDERRVILVLTLAHGTTPEALASVAGLVRNAVERCETARFVRAHVRDFSLAGLHVEAVYDVLGNDYTLYMDTQERINLEIHTQFRAAGIEWAQVAPPR